MLKISENAVKQNERGYKAQIPWDLYDRREDHFRIFLGSTCKTPTLPASYTLEKQKINFKSFEDEKLLLVICTLIRTDLSIDCRIKSAALCIA